jgi:hypothetical protein
MHLRFEEGEGEGEGESLINNNDNNYNDISNYTSYYDCIHNKEQEEEEEEEEKGYGKGSGDKSPLLPSAAQYDDSHNDATNDSRIDHDNENRDSNDDNNGNNDDNSNNKNRSQHDSHSHNNNNDNHNRNHNNSNKNDDDEGGSEEEDEASVKTLLMESKVRSPYPRSSPNTLHTPTPAPTYTLTPTHTTTITSIPLHTPIFTHEIRTELGKEEVNSNDSKKNNNKEKDEGKGKEVSSTMECSRVLENVLKSEEHSLLRNDSLNNAKVEEMSSKSIVIADEEVVETEVVAVHNEKNDKTNKGEEGKEPKRKNAPVTNMDEIKDGDEDSDSDCDTVPSPTLPPTLSTIPPSSAARKTLSMESRDPRISMSRRASRAPPTVLTPALAPTPAPTRPPRTSTQHAQCTQQSLPRPFQPMTHDMDFRSSGRSSGSGSESDDSSSGSNNSSSGEEFSMPSAMTLQDTIKQRSRNKHAESALHSRLSNVAKIKKSEEKEKEKDRANKEIEKSDMGSRLKDGCAMTPMKVRLLCICCVCVCECVCIYVCMYFRTCICMYAFNVSHIRTISCLPSLPPSYPPFLLSLHFFRIPNYHYPHYNKSQQSNNTARPDSTVKQSPCRRVSLSIADAYATSSFKIRSRRSSTGGSTIFSRMSGASHIDDEEERRSSSSLFPLPAHNPHKHRKSFLTESMSPPNLLKMHQKVTGNQVDATVDPVSRSRSSPGNANISLHAMQRSSPDAWQKQFAVRVLNLQNRDKTEHETYSKQPLKISETGPVKTAEIVIPERGNQSEKVGGVLHGILDVQCDPDLAILNENNLKCGGKREGGTEEQVQREGEEQGEGEVSMSMTASPLTACSQASTVASPAGPVPWIASPSPPHTTATTPTATPTPTPTPALTTMEVLNSWIGIGMGIGMGNATSAVNSSSTIPTSTPLTPLESRGLGSAPTPASASGSSGARPDSAVQRSSPARLAGEKRSVAGRGSKAPTTSQPSKYSTPPSPVQASSSSSSSPLHPSPPVRIRQRSAQTEDAPNPFKSCILQHTPSSPTTPTTSIPTPAPVSVSASVPVSLPVPVPASVLVPSSLTPAPVCKSTAAPQPEQRPASPKRDFTFINALLGKVKESLADIKLPSPVKPPLAPPVSSPLRPPPALALPAQTQTQSIALTFEQKLQRVENQNIGAAPVPAPAVVTSSIPSRSPKEKQGGGGRVVRAFSPMGSGVSSGAAVGGSREAVAHTAAQTPPRTAPAITSGRTESPSFTPPQHQQQRDAVSPMSEKRRVRINSQRHHERENIAKIANLPHYQQPLARSAVSGSRAKQASSSASPLKSSPSFAVESTTPRHGHGHGQGASSLIGQATSPFLQITEQQQQERK